MFGAKETSDVSLRSPGRRDSLNSPSGNTVPERFLRSGPFLFLAPSSLLCLVVRPSFGRLRRRLIHFFAAPLHCEQQQQALPFSSDTLLPEDQLFVAVCWHEANTNFALVLDKSNVRLRRRRHGFLHRRCCSATAAAVDQSAHSGWDAHVSGKAHRGCGLDASHSSTVSTNSFAATASAAAQPKPPSPPPLYSSRMGGPHDLTDGLSHRPVLLGIPRLGGP